MTDAIMVITGVAGDPVISRRPDCSKPRKKGARIRMRTRITVPVHVDGATAPVDLHFTVEAATHIPWVVGATPELLARIARARADALMVSPGPDYTPQPFPYAEVEMNEVYIESDRGNVLVHELTGTVSMLMGIASAPGVMVTLIPEAGYELAERLELAPGVAELARAWFAKRTNSKPITGPWSGRTEIPRPKPAPDPWSASLAAAGGLIRARMAVPEIDLSDPLAWYADPDSQKFHEHFHHLTHDVMHQGPEHITGTLTALAVLANVSLTALAEAADEAPTDFLDQLMRNFEPPTGNLDAA